MDWAHRATMRPQRKLLRGVEQSRVLSRRYARTLWGRCFCSKGAVSHRILSVAACPRVCGSRGLTRVTFQHEAYYYPQRPTCQLNSFYERVKEHHGVYVSLPLRKEAKLNRVLRSRFLESRRTKHLGHLPESDSLFVPSGDFSTATHNVNSGLWGTVCAARLDEAGNIGC